MKKITFMLFLLISFNSLNTLAQTNLTDQENNFIQAITKDFMKTHQIDLTGYEFTDLRDIKSTEEVTAKSLVTISMDIVKEQNFVDCAPLFFINREKQKGFVLEKKLDGMNNLYLLTFDNTTKQWKVSDKVNKMGTDITDLGILKKK